MTVADNTIKTPADLITAFRIMAFRFFPYLSSYVYALQPIERRGMGTMAIDKYGRLYYDPEFCEQQTMEGGAYVVLHEAMHLILRHCHRIERVLGPKPSGQDMYDMNIAADLVVWQAMEGVAEHMPKGGVNLPEAIQKYKGIKANMTMEEYFSIIKRHRQEQPKTPEPQKGPSEDKPEPGNIPGDSFGGSQEQDQDKGEGQEEKQSGKGKGEPKPEDQQDGDDIITDGWEPIRGGSAADNQPRDYEEAPDPNWEAFQEDELLERVEQKIEEFEGNPQIQRGAMAGPHVPGCLKVAIKEKLRPTPDPWSRLAAAVGMAASKPVGRPDGTYRKISRRQSAVPDCRLKGVHKLTPKAAVVLDTSGSMCDGETQAKALNVIAQGLRAVGQFPVVAGDTRARSSKQVQNLKQVTWDGGGGTDMTIVLEAADKKYKPDVIVLVTDGYTPWPAQRTRYRLVVACTTDAPVPEWAVTCRIPNKEDSRG
jgi:predicted metal-dependent peptidase